jgi:hypothetical protein
MWIQYRQTFLKGSAKGRVEPGGHPPGAPTDPDVPNLRISDTRHPVPPEKDSLPC